MFYILFYWSYPSCFNTLSDSKGDDGINHEFFGTKYKQVVVRAKQIEFWYAMERKSNKPPVL